MFLKRSSLFIIFFFTMLGVRAQTKGFTIYYSPVTMPASLKTNYYGQFDPKLLAEDLADLLGKATGKTFNSMPYKPGERKGIFLLLDSAGIYSSNEAGILQSDGKDFIRIKAKYTSGISYAMYSWLEQLGFHFYLPGDDWTIIPSLHSIFDKKIIKQVYKPYFKLRMFNASGGIFPVKGLDETSSNEKDWQHWYLRNRMGSDYISIDGHIGEYFNIVHKKEIEADPTILAPINGKRQYNEEGKIDPTNEKGVSLFANWIVSEFKNYQKNMPAFLPFKKYYTVDAGDGLNYCHTPECEGRFPSVSDQVFSITNEAARKIKLFDSRAGVSTLAYTERADTPSFRIEPNVHVMVVPTGFQSVSTPTELMQRWAKKTSNISQYDFLNIGVWAYDMPFYNLYQYHNRLQFLRSLKIEGMNFETSLSKFASGIQQYFILKFLCEPYQSVDKVLDDFCNDNFGKAAMPIKKLLKEWYFNDVHLNTGYDKAGFYPDELGRFIQYIMDAENTAGISVSVKKRIEELKAYTIYLCKFYELFNDQRNVALFTNNPSARSEKAEELLNYTWKLYDSKIFHNTQLNDMLKKYVSDAKRSTWDFRKSDHYKNITQNFSAVVNEQFEIVKQKYLPDAVPFYNINEDFFIRTVKYNADSIRINTIDETAFGNYAYSINFYAAVPGLLSIAYKTDSSQARNKSGNKIAIVGVESNDYRFIKNDFIYKENSNGKLTYYIPTKGYYKLFLSQYNATNTSYVIYPGKNLFYLNKKAILMNGIILQDSAQKKYYPNKWLAFPAPAADSIYFSNLYWNCSNTIRLYSSSGKSLPVNSSRQPFLNSAFNPSKGQEDFIFFDNSTFRWPLVSMNTTPYFFFLKYPLKK